MKAWTDKKSKLLTVKLTEDEHINLFEELESLPQDTLERYPNLQKLLMLINTTKWYDDT